MFSKRAKTIYSFIIILFGICFALILLWAILLDRESMIQFVLDQTDRNYLSDILRENIITPKKFRWVHLASYFLLFVDAATTILLIYKKQRVLGFLYFLQKSAKQVWREFLTVFKQSSCTQNFLFAVLLLIFFSRGLYYAITAPLGYDEIWCYNYYTSKPFYLTLLSYNNYPFYELMTHFTKWLPFPIQINLRLPSLFAGIGTCLVLYACSKKITNHFLTSFSITLLFVFLPFINRFVYCGKGQLIEILFSFISAFSLFFYLKNQQPRYLFVFVVSNIAGIYAIPTYSYFWLIQASLGFIYIGTNKKENRRFFVLSNLWILLLGIACYLPIILGSGISFITKFVWGKNFPIFPFQRIGQILVNNSLYFYGNKYVTIIAVLFTSIIVLFFGKMKKEFLLAYIFGLSLVALPIVVWLIQHIIIPKRSIAFALIFIPLYLLLLFFILNKNKKFFPLFISFLFTLSVICSIITIASFKIPDETQTKQSQIISNLFIDHSISTCYDNAPSSFFWYYYPFLEFYYSKDQKKISINMAAKNSLRYKSFQPTDNYDCIIDSLGADISSYKEHYEIVFSNKEEGYQILFRSK